MNQLKSELVDPYAHQLVGTDFYYQKNDVTAELVVVLQGKLENRSLSIIKQPSRAVNRYHVIELISTDETGIQAGGNVNRIAYLGFAEIINGGILLAGDPFYVQGRLIGTVAGFDETHYPNHLNVVIQVSERFSGRELGFELGYRVFFQGRHAETNSKPPTSK